MESVWKVSVMSGLKVSLMSGTGLPDAIVADEDVGEDDELAHDGDERDLCGLPLGAEAIVDGLEVGVEARGRERRQVKGAAEVAAAAADLRLTLPLFRTRA